MTFQASCKWIPWEKQKQSFIVFSKTLPLNFRLKNHNSLPGYYSLKQFITLYLLIVIHYLVILSSNHINKCNQILVWWIVILKFIFQYKPLFLWTESFTIWKIRETSFTFLFCPQRNVKTMRRWIIKLKFGRKEKMRRTTKENNFLDELQQSGCHHFSHPISQLHVHTMTTTMETCVALYMI